MDDMSLFDPLHRPWTSERIARLGFLLGLGWDSERIARDPIICSRPGTVIKQANRYGLSFMAVRSVSFQVPREAVFVLDLAAGKRSITREALIKLIFLELANEPNLLENILDDQ